MGTRLLIALCIACGCSKSPAPVPAASRTDVTKPDHVLPAFGGMLLGTDRGEWIGELAFQGSDGSFETVLKENVHGIVRNDSGVFVFTGLRHIHTNSGFIYTVTATSNNDIIATRLGRLPGAPSDVVRLPDGATTFLVHSGRLDAKGRPIADCYELRGKVVNRSSSCPPPMPQGANNSFKPSPLRGLGAGAMIEPSPRPLSVPA